jgi:hypothetical protein
VRVSSGTRATEDLLKEFSNHVFRHPAVLLPQERLPYKRLFYPTGKKPRQKSLCMTGLIVQIGTGTRVSGTACNY